MTVEFTRAQATAGLLAAAVTCGVASSASAVCGSSPTYCQTQDTYHHRLGLYYYADYSTPDLSGSDTIYLGTWGGYLGACVNGGFYKILDEYTWTWAAHLNQDSYLCAGDGNDLITVEQGSGHSCDGITLGAFAYNGHALQLFGQAGGDTLNGGNGRDDLCGGSAIDNLNGNSGADRLDGHDNSDRVNGGYNADYSYGDYSGGRAGIYNGGDRLYDTGSYDGGGYADYIYGGDNEGSGYRDCLQGHSTGGNANATVANGGAGGWNYSPYSGTAFCSSNANYTNVDTCRSSCSGYPTSDNGY